MSWGRRHRRSAWVIGFLVLVSLGVAIAALFRSAHRPSPVPLQKAEAMTQTDPSQLLRIDVKGEAKAQPGGRSIGGVVRLPDGKPAPGATVSIYRALSAWPEWRRERPVDQAITGADGAFQFRFESLHGLLIGFEHPNFAGGLEEVSLLRDQVELRLAAGFELYGFVLSDAGNPVPGARVVVEAVLSDTRRAEVRTTAANGRYSFVNLPAGPVRLVARHDSWQPATVPVVVVGDRLRVDLPFERPTMAPLRGRVTSATSMMPIEGALVELLAWNSKLGLVDPIAATTGPDGTFLLAGLPRGTMRVLVRHPEHGAVMRRLAIGAQTAEVQFELPPRSAVTGRLVTDDQPPVFHGGEVLQIRDSAGQLDHAVVEADGRFRFQAPMSPGSASIVVLDRRFAFQRANSVEAAVLIAETAGTQLELPVTAPTLVKGRLVDDAGKALAGGVVMQTKVFAENAHSIGTAAAQFDLSAVGSQVAQLFGYDRDEILAVSAKDGTFQIRGQKPGRLLVRVELPRYGSRWQPIDVPPADEVADLGRIELPRGCRVQGRVMRGDRALAGAAVTVVGRESQAMAVTRGDGVFVVDDLLPGEYRARARLPSQPQGSRERSVTVTADGRSADVILTFDMGRTVRGAVSGTDGQPLPGALVAVRGVVGQTTLTDASGDFLLELPDRAIELQVSLGDRSRQSIVSVPLGQQRVAVKLDTPPVCTLVAQVAGLPGKKRLPGALLRLTKLDGELESETRTRWVDLQDGELRWPSCPVGRVQVLIPCDGYAPYAAERDLVANDEHNLGEVLLEPGSRLQGLVQDIGGMPVANATVLLGEETDLDLFEPLVHSGADGSFRIAGVTSRSSRLVVRAKGFAARTVDLQLPADVLARSPLVVTLERGSTIEVTLEPSADRDGGLVQLRRQGRLLASSEIGENGRAWFPNRSAGSYTVQLFGSDLPPQNVVVEAAVPVVSVRLP